MDIVKMIRDMVSIPSQSSPEEGCKDMAEFVLGLLQKMGAECSLVVCKPEDFDLDPGWDIKANKYDNMNAGKSEMERDKLVSQMFKKPQVAKYNVIGHAGKGKKNIIIHAHMDTVPVNNEKDWRYIPFSGQIEEGKLYGLGSADNKSGIAVALAAFESVKKELDRASLIFAFTSDEEVGGYAGAGYLLEKNMLKGDMVVSLNGSAHKVNVGCHGRMWVKIASSNKDILFSLKSSMNKVNDDFISKEIPARMMSIEEDDDSVIPVFNFLDIKNYEHCFQHIAEGIRQVIPEIDVDIKVTGIQYPAISTMDYRIQNFRSLACDVFRTQVPLRVGAPSDLRFFISKGINGVSFGPIRPLSFVHKPNEHVILEDVYNCKNVLESFIRQ